MTWLAICNLVDPGDGDATPNGDSGTDPNALLAVGTLVAETESFDRLTDPIVLMRYKSDSHWGFNITLRLERDGSVTFRAELAGAEVRISTPADPAGHTDPKRISYAWNAPARRAHLTVENLLAGTVHQVDSDTPFPLPLAEINALAAHSDQRETDASLLYFALSDEVAMPGPLPTLAGPTQIATPDGWRPVQSMAIGELVNTRDAGPVPVRAVIAQEMPALGRYQPLRLRAPYFDLSQDVLIAPHQKLFLNGDMVEYLFGEEEVLVEAGQLTDGGSAFRETRLRTVRYFGLLLDRHEILNVAGAPMESLYDPTDDILNNGHTEQARPVLRPYEALTLRSVRFQ